MPAPAQKAKAERAQAAWTTHALTKDLAAKLRRDLFLVVEEAMLRPDTLQRADLLAMHRKLADLPMVIYEIKTSRADLLADLRAEKWRGYLTSGAVVFAIPAELAEPKEIPTEAGLLVRIAHGWSWRRGVHWHQAPKPTPYLYRRMALSAADQSAARADAALRPILPDLWRTARQARTEQGRRLATLAHELDTYTKALEQAKAETKRLWEDRREYEADIARMKIEMRKLSRAVA